MQSYRAADRPCRRHSLAVLASLFLIWAADTHAAEDPNAAEPASPAPTPPDPEKPPGFVPAERKTTLSWSGSLETDVGYAQYAFDSDALNSEDYFDLRGRMVFGPTVDYGFAGDHFVAARGEAVLWVRELFDTYQVNADDVYAQVGKRGIWDLKGGRFRTWTVYHKGAGFDLYTLEDAGACVTNPCDAFFGEFGPDIYEVNYIYRREPAGHAALHLYPTEWSGIEIAGTYGKETRTNTWGVRGAGMLDFDFLRVMAAGEYRTARFAEEQSTADPVTGQSIECEKCGFSERFGFGGGAELNLAPVALGINAAQGKFETYDQTTGIFNLGSSHTVTSLGGYAEVDVGSLTLQRSVILGFGVNRTEQEARDEDFNTHLQGAAYAVYPLGFNDASLKLVVSRAELESLALIDETARVFSSRNSSMNAGRVRLTLPF